jgi:hypothetical protein
LRFVTTSISLDYFKEKGKERMILSQTNDSVWQIVSSEDTASHNDLNFSRFISNELLWSLGVVIDE